MEKLLHSNGNQKKAGEVRHMSDKTEFKIKTIIGHKEGHYILIKESIQEEYIITVNTYTPNIGAPQQWQTLTSHLQQWTDCLDRKLVMKHKA